MFNQLQSNNWLVKCFLFLLVLDTPFLGSAQTDAERAKIVSGYDQKAIAALQARFKQEEIEREERIALYLQRTKAERSFSKDNSLYIIYDIRPDGTPIYQHTKNVASGQVINAHKLHNNGGLGINIQGQGMTVGVWDGGPIRATHELLTGQASQFDGSMLTDIGGQNHMAHVTGTIVGKVLSTMNPEAAQSRGIAFNATARCYDWNSDVSEMTAFGNAGFLVSNHSYGPNNGPSDPIWHLGAYDSRARSFDEMLKNLPNYLPFIAAGNEQTSSANTATKMGYDVMSGMNVGKNVMVVGAINQDLSMSYYSNWGPTDDGRIKPDLVAKGTGITSAQATANDAYTTGNGTSYATPAAAALAVLLQQYHNSVKSSYLSAAGLKGLMLHTATDLGQTGPDYKFGWGVANGEKAALTIQASNSDLTMNNSTVKIAQVTTNPAVGANLTYTLKAKGGLPLSASICWTDDEGTEQVIGDGIDPTTPRIVHNFDIKVVDQVTMTEYFPWKGPGMANRTADATRTGPNDVDNFKRVDVDAPVAGRNYQIVITKRDLPAVPPGQAPKFLTDRPFTIIISGLEGTALPVELLSLEAQTTEGGKNLVTWATGTEINSHSFDIERSQDGATFSKIGNVKAQGKAGNYSFVDNTPLPNINYYRLKAMDNDQKFEYSKVVSVQAGKTKSTIKIYPSTTNDVIMVENNGLTVDRIAIYNTSGQLVLATQSKNTVSLSHLPSGMYFVQVQAGQEKVVEKVVKQ